MTAIANFGASKTTATTNTSATVWADVVTYTFAAADQVAGATYAVFWQGAFAFSFVTTDYQVRVTEGGTAKAEINVEPRENASPVDRDQQGGFFFFTAGATPADVAFALQIKAEASGTATAHNGQLRIVKLPANSVWAENTGSVSNSTTANSDILGSALSVSGEYLFLASSEIGSGTTAAARLAITVDGTEQSNLVGGVSDAANFAALTLVAKATATAAANVAVRSTSASLAGVARNTRFLALKVSDFRNIFFARLGADSSGTQTAYATSLTLAETVNAGDHLLLAGFAMHSGSTTLSGYANLTSDGTQVDELIRESAVASVAGTPAATIARLESYSAGSRTWTIQRKSESTNTTRILAGSSIAVIDLDDGGGVGPPADITGTSAATETGKDTFTASGTVPLAAITGSFAATETGTDTAASTGTVAWTPTTGALSATESGVDTAAASGSIAWPTLTGALATTEAGSDTAAGSGSLSWSPLSGSLAATEAGADTSLASGLVAWPGIAGSAAAQEAAGDAFTASGSVAWPNVTGALSGVEIGSDTATSTGSVDWTALSGSFAGVEAGQDGFAASGSVGFTGITGALAATEATADTATGAGSVAWPALTGSMAAAEQGSDAFASNGLIGYTGVAGALAAQETGGDAGNAVGSVAWTPVTGLLSARETGADTLAAVGSVTYSGVTGALAASEDGNDIHAGSGVVGWGAVTGSLAATEGGQDSATATGQLGHVPITGAATAGETGSDDFASTGEVIWIAIDGSLVVREAGADLFVGRELAPRRATAGRPEGSQFNTRPAQRSTTRPRAVSTGRR